MALQMTDFPKTESTKTIQTNNAAAGDVKSVSDPKVEDINVATWEEFLKYLEDLRKKHRQRKRSPGTPPSQLLFRGQENSCWSLSTTLERPPDGREGMPFGKYYVPIHQVKHEIESFTGENWELPDLYELAVC